MERGAGVTSRILRAVLLLAMVAVGILFALDIAYMMTGSLEQFQTDEQEDKVRRVTIVIAVLLLIAELVLWLAYRGLVQELKSPQPETSIIPPAG